MSEQHIQQLNSPNAAERRAAIIALACEKNPAAIPALNAVCRADPDLDLRVLATKAVNTIEKHVRAAEKAASPAPEPVITPLPGRSSKRNEALGEFYLNAATNYHMVRDRARTLENLGKALGHDPELAHEDYVRNLIEQVIDRDYAEAVAILSDEARLKATIAQIGGKLKLKRRQLHGVGAESATWERVQIEIGVLLLTATLGALLMLLLALPPLQEIFDSFSYNFTAQISDRIADVRAMNAALKFGLALLAGTAITLTTLLSGAFAHATAIYAHAGEGTLVYLLRRLTRLAIGAVIIGTGTVLFMMLLDDPALRLTMLNLVGSVEIVILVVLQSVTIGEVYNFGSWNGCGALFVGGVAISAIATAIGLVAVWVIH